MGTTDCVTLYISKGDPPSQIQFLGRCKITGAECIRRVCHLHRLRGRIVLEDQRAFRQWCDDEIILRCPIITQRPACCPPPWPHQTPDPLSPTTISSTISYNPITMLCYARALSWPIVPGQPHMRMAMLAALWGAGTPSRFNVSFSWECRRVDLHTAPSNWLLKSLLNSLCFFADPLLDNLVGILGSGGHLNTRFTDIWTLESCWGHRWARWPIISDPLFGNKLPWGSFWIHLGPGQVHPTLTQDGQMFYVPCGYN
jgi:hypothetical protein